jgi:PAS domain S-box-containing protein
MSSRVVPPAPPYSPVVAAPDGAPSRTYDLLDALPNPVYVWRRMPDGAIRLAYANVAGHRETRGKVAALIGGDLHELYDAHDPEIVRLICETLEDGEPRRIEHEYFMRSTGELHWFRTSYMRTGAGEVVVENEDLTERRAAEARIEASEARFRALFEQGLTAMSLTRFDGSFLAVNPAFCEMVGHTEAGLLATTFMALTHPDDVDEDVARLAMLVRGETSSYRMEKRLLHADGRVVHAELSAQLVRDAAGQPLYLLAQMQDVTGRKHAEAAERRERARLAELFERAPAIICTLRAPDHVYEMANEECRRLVGREELIGLPVAEVLPDLAEQGFLAILDDVIATGQPFTARALAIPIRPSPDAPLVERYLNVDVQPIEGADGLRSATFVHCVDVTEIVTAGREQERLAAELQASQERHELVLRATNELIYDWDLRRDSVFYSDALYSTFQYPRPDVDDSSAWWLACIHPDDRDGISSSLQDAFARGAAFWLGEYRFRRGDGAYVVVVDRGHILRDADGAPVRMIGSMVDVTERRQLEASLRESQKMEAVGRLAGGVAHDFNNLLCAILGYADLALMDAPEASTIRGEIEEIRKAAQRATQLTKQLLAFGRRQMRRPTRVDVDQVVRDTDRLLSQLLGDGIQLTVQPGVPGATVHMDPSELDQILVNLAVNARDAMPHGGSVSIETSRALLPPRVGSAEEVECVLLCVSDTGCGIDAATLPHIFEPFFTTKGEGGTGLGLSTVYGIVEGIGGRIEVDTTVGAGTRFRVHLPLAEDAAPPAPEPEPEPEPVPPAATVLLTEDESGVRILAHRILERSGFRVLVARHGADALLLWRDHAAEIDLVVTDLVMPEMGGRELADALQAMRPDLPVLFMSGYSDDEVTRRGIADSRVAFLAKPFTTDSLVGAVREALKRG